MIILDTNVVSSIMAGDGAIDEWLSAIASVDLYLTVVTRAEIRYGLARLPAGRRRLDLTRRADALFADIADRTVAFDVRAADAYGDIVATRERTGRPISVPDAQIASIALVHRATVATRTTPDFEHCGIVVVNPFRSPN